MYAFWERFIAFISLWIGWTARGNRIAAGSIVLDDVKGWIEQQRERWGVHGISVAVVTSPDYKHGDGGWQKEILSFGTADGQSRPITPKTIWSSPSTSKFITSLALAHLIDSNVTLSNGERLDWDTQLDPIFQTTFPEWTTGCSKALYDLGNNIGALHPRDAQFRMASHVVENLSNQPFLKYANRYIMAPMRSTYLLSADHDAHQHALRVDGFIREGIDIRECSKAIEGGGDVSHHACMGTARNIGWGRSNEVERFHIGTDRFDDERSADEWAAGASGFTVSGAGMVKLLRSVLDRDSPIPRLVDLDPIHGILKDYFPEHQRSGSGFAIECQDYFTHPLITHGGSLEGQTTRMSWVPEDGIAVMVALNDETYGEEITRKLALTLVEKLLREESLWKWEDRLQWDLKWRLDRRPIIPTNPVPPSVDIRDGFTLDGGFLIPWPPTDDDGPLLIRQRRAILRAVASQTEYHLNLSGPIYTAEMIRPDLPDRILFTHWDANHWNWTAINLYDYPPDPGSATMEHQTVFEMEEAQMPILATILGTGGVEASEEGLRFEGIWWDICGERVVLSENQPPDVEEGNYAVDVVRESFAPRENGEAWRRRTAGLCSDDADGWRRPMRSKEKLYSFCDRGTKTARCIDCDFPN